MRNLPYDVPPSQSPERRYRRFTLQHPVRMTVHFAESVIELDGLSRNVSIGGLLLETYRMIPPQTPVSFVMTVYGEHVRPMKFSGEGRVVRVDAKESQAAFAIAVECWQPITQLEDYLATTGS